MSTLGQRIYLLAVLVAMTAGGCTSTRAGAPATRQPAGPAPHEIQARRKLHQPPRLVGSGEEARRATAAFVGWAAFSTVGEREDARQAIVAARDNEDILAALCVEAFAAQKKDHSRALIVLSILGEMRSSTGEECLKRFMRLPWPQEGRMVDGEIIEQTSLGTLQAKAIDGLAYLHNESGDAEVLRAVASHPSRIVRAEAISAYLWNHQNSAESRAALARSVRRGEEIFLDRVRREPGENKESFNRRLKAYLAAHPELVPPAPDAAQADRPYLTKPEATEKSPSRQPGEPPPPR